MGLAPYWVPIRTALVFFPLLAMLILLPWLIYNYRKYGFLSAWTSIVVYSFIFYGLCAFFLVILPLPETRNNCSGHTADTVYQALVPFAFVRTLLKNENVVWSSLGTYGHLLKDLAFLQALFNMFLFLPLGVYLRYFGVKFKNAVTCGFLVSLFFEVTQRTGIFGFYKCPYRLFDVDDLMINTFGALVGFVIAPLVLAIFPSVKDVEAKAGKVMAEHQVRPFARLIALFVDLSLIGILNIWKSELWVIAGYMFVFIAMPIVFKGATPGTALMRFRLQAQSEMGYIVRAISLYATRAVYVMLDVLFRIPLDFESELYHYQLVLILMTMAGSALLTLALTVHGLRVIWLKRIEHFYFDKISKVINVRAR